MPVPTAAAGGGVAGVSEFLSPSALGDDEVILGTIAALAGRVPTARAGTALQMDGSGTSGRRGARHVRSGSAELPTYGLRVGHFEDVHASSTSGHGDEIDASNVGASDASLAAESKDSAPGLSLDDETSEHGDSGDGDTLSNPVLAENKGDDDP